MPFSSLIQIRFCGDGLSMFEGGEVDDDESDDDGDDDNDDAKNLVTGITNRQRLHRRDDLTLVIEPGNIYIYIYRERERERERDRKLNTSSPRTCLPISRATHCHKLESYYRNNKLYQNHIQCTGPVNITESHPSI